MKEKMEILVTGAAGFVGSSIVRELRTDKNSEIYGLIGLKSEIRDVNPEWFRQIFRSDISEKKTLQKPEELEKVNVLIHSAGLAHQFGKTKKEDFWRVNVKGTENICRLAEKLKVEHFVLISSVAVYGNHGEIEVDESCACEPKGFYAESKLESEKIAIEICEKSGIDLTVLRLATVIGEGDRGNVSRLITLIDGRRFFWIGQGNNKKSLIYKDDVAKGVLRIVENRKNSGTEIYNLTSKAVTMKEIVEAISKSLSKLPRRIKVSPRLLRNLFRVNKRTLSLEPLKKIEKTVEKWLSNDIFSGKKMSEVYDFEPQTSISEAIAKQVSYYLKQKREVKSTK